MSILAKGQITISSVFDGDTISISISGGVRSVAYAADGTNPNPLSSTPFSVVVLKNNREVKPILYKWICGGNLTGSSTSATFTPQISKTYQSGSSYVGVEVVLENGASSSSQTVPVVSTKNADGLDWLVDWNSGKTTIKDKSIASPRIFAGENKGNNLSPQLYGVALGKDVLSGGASKIGLVGYNNNKPVFKFDNLGNFLISPDGDAGKVVVGTGNGIYFDGNNLNISGKVIFRSGTEGSQAGVDSSTVVNTANGAMSKIDNLEIGGVNLLVLRTITSGKYLNSSGATVDNVDWFYSDYISVSGMKNLTTSGYTNLGTSPSTVYYDANKNYIKGINNNNQSLAKTITIDDSRIAYIRFSGMMADTRTLKIEKGLKSTEYSPSPYDVEDDILYVNGVATGASSLATEASQNAKVNKSLLEDITKIEGGATYIDGGKIYTNSIVASSLDLYSGLTVKNKETGDATFSVANNGDVSINGLLQSTIFNESQGLGYRITPDGKAILNQAKVSGEFIMPNAGITNYGATIGNENLARNTSGLSASERDSAIEGNLVKGTKVTISLDFDCQGLVAGSQARIGIEGSLALEGSSSRFYYGLWHNISDGVDFKGRKSMTYTLPANAVGRISTIHYYTGLVDTLKSVKREIGNLKIEIGDKATPWCPNKDEQLDYTRIWAGARYEARDSAPFRVTQKGEVWATNATLSGRLLGNYDNGKVHIYNDEIVIDGTSTMMLPEGRIVNLETKDSSPDPRVKLTPGQVILNTDVVFGSNTDKRIEYLNSNRKFNLYNTEFNIGTTTGLTTCKFDTASGAFSGLNLVATKNNGHHVLRHSSSADKSGTLVIDSEGGQGQTGDFSFTRKNYGEDVKVDISGELVVKTKITTTQNKIEQRMASDGWGWYSI